MTVGLIQIPHQPLGSGTNIFWSSLTYTNIALLLEAQDMGKLSPAGAQHNLAVSHCLTSGKQWSALSWSLTPCFPLQQECCGTSGPMDWVNFTSTFRAATPEVVFPWPPLCCRRTGNFIPLNEEGCRLGHVDYLFTKVCPLPPAAPVCGLPGPL